MATRELLHDVVVNGCTIRVEHVIDDDGSHAVELSGVDCDLEGEMPGLYYPRLLTPRVVKWRTAIRDELLEMDRIDAALRGLMSKRNPPGRHLLQERRRAEHRLATARRRLAEAETARDSG